MKRIYHQHLLVSGLCAVMVFMAGCAATSPNTDREPDALSLLGNGYSRLSQDISTEKTNPPVNADEATRLMLLHSPRVRSLLASAGVADAQRAQASLVSNPKFAAGALRPEGGGRWQLDFGLTQSLLDLFTRGLRQQLAEQELIEAQWRIRHGLQSLVGELQQTWFSAIAAQEIQQLRQVQLQASQARVTLAQSLYDAGNIPESTLLLHKLDASQQHSNLDKAALTASGQKLMLARLLGISPEDLATLPMSLAAIPDETLQAELLIKEGQSHQPALLLLKDKQQQLQHQASMTGQSTWRNVSVGIESERESDGSWNKGGSVEWGLPIFDRGRYRQQAIESLLTQNEALQADANLQLVQQVNTALQQMHYARLAENRAASAAGIASQRLALLQREVNFMITSPFELLTGKQQALQLEEDAVHARENYWLARNTLEQAIGKQLALPENTEVAPTAESAIDADIESEHNHHHHHGAHQHD